MSNGIENRDERDERAQVWFSARWYPYPFRVMVGQVPLAHGDDLDDMQSFADRFNQRLTCTVLTGGGVRG